MSQLSSVPRDVPAASTTESPRWHEARNLGDGVLQTSEEAVIGEGLLPSSGDAVEAGQTALQKSRLSIAQGSDAVKRYVAQNPGKSALMAAAAGALVTALLGSQAKKYSRTIDWSRVRLPYQPAKFFKKR